MLVLRIVNYTTYVRYVIKFIFISILLLSIINMFRVLVLATYPDEIPIIQVVYEILKMQYLAHKGFVGSWNDVYL